MLVSIHQGGQPIIQRGKIQSGRGIVKVESGEGHLRLCWTYQGKRRSLAVGLPDGHINRGHAERLALQIELGISSGNYDSTLTKYKPQRQIGRNGRISCAELFEKFMHIQKTSKSLRVGSMCRYAGAQRHLSKFFREKPAAFVEHVLQSCSDRTTKDYLLLIRACWDWGKEQQLLEFERNPWLDVLEEKELNSGFRSSTTFITEESKKTASPAWMD